MIQQALIVILDLCVIWLAAFLAAGSLIAVTDVVNRVWWGWRQRARLRYATYVAEQTIRDIKRRAVRDLLTVERHYNATCFDPDVIESTAVEVGQDE